MLSYTRGPDAPLIDKTIFDAFRDTAARFPDREALAVRHQQVRLTYGELRDRVDETARGLIGLGLRPGDRVGVWATTCLEWILVQFACARGAFVLVNVNPAYRAHDLGYVLRKSRVRALFLRRQDARANYGEILHETGVAVERTIFLGEPSWHEMIANGRDADPPLLSPQDVANIQYTSGTTGNPKGVLLTHHGLVNNAWFGGEAMGLTEIDRVVMPLPMYHCSGCVLGSLMCFLFGCTLVLPNATFDAGATLQAVEDERGTVLTGVPTMYIAELSHPEFSRFDLTSLRAGFMGGAPCPVEVLKRVVEDMHCAGLGVVYGQTEASPLVTMTRLDDSFELRMSTVGGPLANTEVKIASPGGETAKVGEIGELCTRGYLVMKGYDEEPEATARAIDSQGWLHTGDLAVMRPDGYFHITGRTREMIIRGGENIFPSEIEQFLFTHPKVADVQVVGLPDQKLGEIVLAWIKLREDQSATEQEMRDFCAGKIAHFKIPQFIRFVDAFPMTVTGKVQKFKIREIEIRERGLEKAAHIQTA